MTSLNPIEEIKSIRHQLGANAEYDIHRVFADLRRTQSSSNRSYVDLSPRRIVENRVLRRSGEGDVPDHQPAAP